MKYKVVFLSLLSFMAIPKVAAYDYFSFGRTILYEARNKYAKIPVSACRYAKEIQIQVEDDVFVTKGVFYFQNGEKHTFQFQRKFDRNERSAWREFSYPRCVTDIQLHGRASDKRAVVKVYGRR